MELTRAFKDLTRNDAGIAGGKGASLGEMTRAGIPVPPGFVVLSGTFERFIEETNLVEEIDTILHKVDHKEIHTVEKASEEIQALILDAEMPKDIAAEIERQFKKLDTQYVAVRSSATAEDSSTAAWAGQLDSFLNTTEKDLLEKVKHCWASLFTPRAIFYRFEKELHKTKISVAVVVQKMVNSEKSGIAFSVHPVTQDYNQLIIEAGFGLGEAIVSGQITPDSYVVEKEPRRMLDISVNTQTRGLYRVSSGGNEWIDIPEPRASSQVLNEKQISELAEIILHIEKHYGFPCDIEWAFEKGKFYIVQSRPITTLAPQTSESKKKSEVEFVSPELKGFKPEDYKFFGMWKNDLFGTYFWQDGWVPELMQELGLSAKGLGVINLAGGNFFVKKTELKSIFDQVAKKIDEGDEDFFKSMVRVADRVFESEVKVGQSVGKMEANSENFEKFAIAARKINLIWNVGASHLTDIAEAKLQETVVKESFPAEHVMDIIPKVVTPLTLRHDDLVKLKRELGNKSLAEIQKDKKLNKKLKDLADKYPWVEMFNFVGDPITPEKVYEQAEHVEVGKETAEYVPEKPLSEELKFRARCLRSCGYLKQAGAEYFSIFTEKVMPFLQNVAKKIGMPYREFVTLSVPEMALALEGKISTAELKQRAKRRIDVNRWVLIGDDQGRTIFVEEPSDIDKLIELMVPRADKDSEEIKGEVGNPGKYTGPVKVIMNTYDFAKMMPGDVLVSTMTTPDFVILMQKSGAIVTDIGGMLCHAAIVSREIGKPCVIGTRFATQILHDGDIVEVDADNGVVRIISKKSIPKEGDIYSWLKNSGKWEKIGTRKATLHRYFDFVECSYVASKELFNTNLDSSVCFLKNGEINQYQLVSDYDSYIQGFDLFFESSKNIAYAHNHMVADSENFIKWLKDNCSKDKVKSLPTGALVNLLKERHRLHQVLAAWQWFGFTGKYAIEKSIKKRLQKYSLPDSDVERVLSLSEPVFVLREDLTVKNIALDVQKGKISKSDLKNRIESHIAEYGYFVMYDETYSPMTYQTVSERIDRYAADNKLCEEVDIALSNFSKNKDAFEKFIKNKKFSKDDFSFFKFAHDYAQFMELKNQYRGQSAILSIPLYSEIAERLNTTIKDLLCFSDNEISEFLFGDSKLSLDEAKKRSNNSVLVYKEGKYVVETDPRNIKDIENTVIAISEEKVIKGNAAFPGKVQGIVKIINSTEQIDKLNDGDVLVSSMTRPDFLIAINKAVAIVTDEGGITCHAAIVSRELKKPCVIGTKIATKVLHDGDMVEVDADKGIVRIIK